MESLTFPRSHVSQMMRENDQNLNQFDVRNPAKFVFDLLMLLTSMLMFEPGVEEGRAGLADRLPKTSFRSEQSHEILALGSGKGLPLPP